MKKTNNKSNPKKSNLFITADLSLIYDGKVWFKNWLQ